MATNNNWNNQIAAANSAITLNSGTNAVSISTDASNTTVNVATGGAVKTATFGSVNSTSATTVQSGSGALNVTATGGALTINSGTGALSISNDASATTVNIASGGAAKVVQLGSTSGASSLALKYGTADFSLASATGTAMSALDTGEITYPLQPAFLSLQNANQTDVTGDGTVYTVLFQDEVFDQNSDFDGTSTFTAPVTGRYRFNYGLYVDQIGALHNAWIWGLVSSNSSYRLIQNNPIIYAQGTSNCMSVSAVVDMDSSDTCSVTLAVYNSTKTVDISGNTGVGARVTWFGGNLVC